MYPNSALSAGQLTVMAVVVAVSLAAWLIAVFLAARQPRGTSAIRQSATECTQTCRAAT